MNLYISTLKLNLLILFFPLFLVSISAQNERYHKVKAKNGDNVHTLLQRYHLDKKDCNYNKFYSLNQLDRTALLYEGKKYFIPVLIYDYNGKSIRSTLGISTWEQAVRIKDYNELILREDLRKMTLVKSNILWVPHHELYCDASSSVASNQTKKEKITPKKEPEVKENIEKETVVKRKQEEFEKIDESTLIKDKNISGYRKFPIFGKKNAYIPLLDNKLRGKVFYVVSGHGGPDVGAVGKVNGKQLCEDEYAYDVALRVVRNLLEHGAIAYMITRDPNDGLRSGEMLPCDYDEYCWGNYKIPRSQKTRLFQRSDAINKLYERHRKQGIRDQTALVIHIDSRSTRENTDVFFYYYPGSSPGRKLVKKLHKTFAEKYKKYRKNGRYEGTVTARDLHMLREVKPNCAFIELGNIRNSYDQQRFIKESNREALAKWLYEGLIR